MAIANGAPPPLRSVTTGDMPHIASSTYTGTAYGIATGDAGSILMYHDPTTITGGGTGPVWVSPDSFMVSKTVMFQPEPAVYQDSPKPKQGKKEDAMPEKSTSRFVRVIIVDPNENLSLDDRLVYKGEEKFTDLNDQELFFELDIKSLLTAHNDKRTKTIDKSVKERTEYLDAARIRDLKMVVVNIASF